MTADAVHTELVLLYGGSTPIRSRWSYRASAPFTVTVAFQTAPNRWVEWLFARDLLVTGLRTPAGIGDVRIRPESPRGVDVLVIEIESPEGFALLKVDHEAVEAFLDATTDLVPLGAEADYFDVDALIEKLTRTCG